MSKNLNISESTLIKQTFGKLKRIIINSHTSGIIKIWDDVFAGVQPQGTITSSGASAPTDFAVQTLTSDATAVSDGDTVVLGATGGTSRTYRAKTTPIAINDVAIGSTADGSAFLANLKKAINGTGIGDGSDYFAGTQTAPEIIAYALTSTTLKIAFRTRGTGGNAYTTTETSSHLSFGAGTLAGGVVTTAAQVVIDSVTYLVTKTLSETIGLPAVANEVLWVTNEATFLANLKKAINDTGVPGTDYGTGTLPHPTVYATTNTATTQVVLAKKTGSAGNSIATTTTLANYAWGAATLASGTGPTGRLMHNSMTLSAVATTGERFIDFCDESFDVGLYVQIVSGSADLTVIYD